MAIGVDDGFGDKGDSEVLIYPEEHDGLRRLRNPGSPGKADMRAYGATCTIEATGSGVQNHCHEVISHS